MTNTGNQTGKGKWHGLFWVSTNFSMKSQWTTENLPIAPTLVSELPEALVPLLRAWVGTVQTSLHPNSLMSTSAGTERWDTWGKVSSQLEGTTSSTLINIVSKNQRCHIQMLVPVTMCVNGWAGVWEREDECLQELSHEYVRMCVHMTANVRVSVSLLCVCGCKRGNIYT